MPHVYAHISIVLATEKCQWRHLTIRVERFRFFGVNKTAYPRSIVSLRFWWFCVRKFWEIMSALFKIPGMFWSKWCVNRKYIYFIFKERLPVKRLKEIGYSSAVRSILEQIYSTKVNNWYIFSKLLNLPPLVHAVRSKCSPSTIPDPQYRLYSAVLWNMIVI